MLATQVYTKRFGLPSRNYFERGLRTTCNQLLVGSSATVVAATTHIRSMCLRLEQPPFDNWRKSRLAQETTPRHPRLPTILRTDLRGATSSRHDRSVTMRSGGRTLRHWVGSYTAAATTRKSAGKTQETNFAGRSLTSLGRACVHASSGGSGVTSRGYLKIWQVLHRCTSGMWVRRS